MCGYCYRYQKSSKLVPAGVLLLYVSIYLGLINPLIASLKPQSNGPSYSNTVIGTLAADEWAVTFGTARIGLSSHRYQLR